MDLSEVKVKINLQRKQIEEIAEKWVDKLFKDKYIIIASEIPNGYSVDRNYYTHQSSGDVDNVMYKTANMFNLNGEELYLKFSLMYVWDRKEINRFKHEANVPELIEAGVMKLEHCRNEYTFLRDIAISYVMRETGVKE